MLGQPGASIWADPHLKKETLCATKTRRTLFHRTEENKKMGPYILGGLAILLAVAGIVLLVVYLTGGGGGITLSRLRLRSPPKPQHRRR